MIEYKAKVVGFTLIELLVAMALGMILLVSVLKVGIESYRHFLFQSEAAMLLENGQFAATKLGDYLRQTGFEVAPGDDPRAGDLWGCNAGVCTVGGVAAVGDTISIRFDSTAETPDCVGRISVGGIVTNTFYVANNTLTCQSTITGLATMTQQLIPDVINMQILYGVDNDADKVPERYFTYPAADIEKVVVLRVGVLVQTPNSIGEVDNVSYTLADRTDITAANQRLHKAFNITVALRNRIRY